jgi:hypothetical protein
LVKFFADGGTGLIPPLVYTAPIETIGKTRVVTTMVGGKIVYNAAP